jgi:hypothetical protein
MRDRQDDNVDYSTLFTSRLGFGTMTADHTLTHLYLMIFLSLNVFLEKLSNKAFSIRKG